MSEKTPASGESVTPTDDRGVCAIPRSRQATRASYDRLSRFYDRLAGPFEGPFSAAALELLAPAPGEVVLEIGFGTGRALEVLARAVGPESRVYGIDLSEGMKREASARLERAGLLDRAVLRCGDAVELPFPSGRFDAVFLSFTLELFDTPEIPVVLGQCRRVLKEGGRLGVVSLAGRTPPSFAERTYVWLHRRFPTTFDCRPISVRRCLEAAGLRVRAAECRVAWGLGIDIVLAESDARRIARPLPSNRD